MVVHNWPAVRKRRPQRLLDQELHVFPILRDPLHLLPPPSFTPFIQRAQRTQTTQCCLQRPTQVFLSRAVSALRSVDSRGRRGREVVREGETTCTRGPTLTRDAVEVGTEVGKRFGTKEVRVTPDGA